MGFPRLRPRSMFKRRANTELKKSKLSCQGIDDSVRTYDDSSRSDDDCILSSDPAASSLDECPCIPRGAHQDVLNLIQRRLSHNSKYSSTRSSTTTSCRVSFLDEELGLTPRHVVTQIHYRPRTTDDEKHDLYYNGHDFGIFEQEELYDKIENEIQEIERQQQKASGQRGLVVVMNEMKIKNLMCTVEDALSSR